MIDSFTGQYEFLSNFYMHPFVMRGVEMQSGEHAFQAMKCIEPEDCIAILDAPTPGKAKRLGRRCSLRLDWEEVKVEVMLEVVRAKMDPIHGLSEQLTSTGAQMLVEGNTWHDNYWGDCHCSKCVHIEGQNVLGIILMTVRHEICPTIPIPDYIAEWIPR